MVDVWSRVYGITIKMLGSVLLVESLEKTEKTVSKFSFGELLKKKRVAMGYSARKLSAKCEVSQSYISKVEANDIVPTVKTFGRIADALRFSDAEIRFLLKVASTVEN
jgi:predicted transcriptional regulator